MTNFPPNDFDYVMEDSKVNFTVIGANQEVIELCEGGADKLVKHANCLEYIELATKALLNQGDK